MPAEANVRVCVFTPPKISVEDISRIPPETSFLPRKVSSEYTDIFPPEYPILIDEASRLLRGPTRAR